MTHVLHKGRPKTADISTKAVLLAVKCSIGEDGPPPADYLVAAYGCVHKVAWSALYREVDRQLLDYGTSINRPWLTPLGEQHLAELRAQEELESRQ